ncbi:MAG: desulforedoxin [Acidobacteriota bacterium]
MSQLGKRYKCEKCGIEVLCTKPGEGKFFCCGEEMKTQEPKPLPSSD